MGSITLVILLLMSKPGWYNGFGYAVGYLCAYSLIGIGAVLLQYQATENGTEKISLIPVLEIFFGLLLLWIATKNFRKTPSSGTEESRFSRIMENITPIKAFAFGAVVAVINFKNLGLFLSALSIAILSDISVKEKIIIALLDALVFSLSVILPNVIYILLPAHRDVILNKIKLFLSQHSREISIWLPIVFGLIFITKGVSDIF